MKKIFYFLAISLLLIGCEGNNPESERPLNQPCHYSQSKGQWVIDTDWSPAGKKYTLDVSDHLHVIDFLDEGNVHMYNCNDNSLSEPYNKKEGIYEGDYPDFSAEFSAPYTYHFSDTLTLIITSYSGETTTYRLLH